MTNTAKDIRRAELLKWAKETGISIVHIFNEDHPKGGITVAFRKHMPEHSSTNMVQFSVAVCSKKDTFQRKEGTLLALESFNKGDTVSLPLSDGVKDEDLSLSIKKKFRQMFFYFLYD